VGDVIANSVPGVAGTAAHKVTAVIVTHTDHDFVDVTIKKTAESAAKQTVKGGAKSWPTLTRCHLCRRSNFSVPQYKQRKLHTTLGIVGVGVMDQDRRRASFHICG
jgi:hypothetical protein